MIMNEGTSKMEQRRSMHPKTWKTNVMKSRKSKEGRRK
jgi:hypothetical protein